MGLTLATDPVGGMEVSLAAAAVGAVGRGAVGAAAVGAAAVGAAGAELGS